MTSQKIEMPTEDCVELIDELAKWHVAIADQSARNANPCYPRAGLTQEDEEGHQIYTEQAKIKIEQAAEDIEHILAHYKAGA